MFDTIPKLLRDFAFKRSSKNVLFEKDENGVFHPITWNKLYELCSSFGAGLLSLGVKKGDHIGIISDNRSEWLIADLGILGIGCADVPRGSDSMADEIAYILNHGDCSVALAEDETQLQKILSVRKSVPRLRNIIVIDPHYEKTAASGGESDYLLSARFSRWARSNSRRIPTASTAASTKASQPIWQRLSTLPEPPASQRESC